MTLQELAEIMEQIGRGQERSLWVGSGSSGLSLGMGSGTTSSSLSWGNQYPQPASPPQQQTSVWTQQATPPPVLHEPEQGHWALALWAGAGAWGGPGQVSVREVQVGLLADEAGLVDLGAASTQEGQEVTLLLRARVRVDADLRQAMRVLHEGEFHNLRSLLRTADQTATPPPSALDPALLARLRGPWWLVAGPDVRVVEAGRCPATHLPVLAGTTEAELRVLAAAACLGEIRHRMAPELMAAGPTLAAMHAFSERLDRLSVRLDAYRRGGLPRGEPVVPDADQPDAVLAAGLAQHPDRPEDGALAWRAPPKPRGKHAAPEPTSTWIARGTGPVHVAALDEFYGWAAAMGLTDPVNVGTTYWPGAERVMAWPVGWWAAIYPDHARVGRWDQA